MIDLTGSDSDDEAPAPSPQRAPKRTVDQIDLTADDNEDDAPRKKARTAADADFDAWRALGAARPPCITEFTEAQLKEPLKLPNGQPNPAHPCIIWRNSLPKKRPFTVKLIIDDARARAPRAWEHSHRGPRAGIGNDGITLCVTSIVVQAAKPKNPIPKIMAWLKKNKMSIITRAARGPPGAEPQRRARGARSSARPTRRRAAEAKGETLTANHSFNNQAHVLTDEDRSAGGRAAPAHVLTDEDRSAGGRAARVLRAAPRARRATWTGAPRRLQRAANLRDAAEAAGLPSRPRLAKTKKGFEKAAAENRAPVLTDFNFTEEGASAGGRAARARKVPKMMKKALKMLEAGGAGLKTDEDWKTMRAQRRAVASFRENFKLPARLWEQREVLRCVDLHCGGEPATVVFGGGGVADAPGATMFAKRAHVMERMDRWREPKRVAEGGSTFAPSRAQVKAGVRDQHPVDHPDFDYPGPDILAFRGPSATPGVDAKNTVVMSNGYSGMLDRSPCGSGACAIMALLRERANCASARTVHESVVGSIFTGRLAATTTVGGFPAVEPTIAGPRGSRYAGVVVDPTDPFPAGYRVADIATVVIVHGGPFPAGPASREIG
ncbi:trans-L-3-hydroxyproline dehydratase [Aureococcus anophagefferens]|uniref:Trans-L-3-hydroxyproline dehydratase n=1 Tax=Aureococcus anophagefferens TaxID=44056 RepID=A0ABR1FH57_AURAN